MRKTSEFMSDFMKKLDSGEFDKYIIEPASEGVELTEKFVENKIEEFDKLLKSDIMKNLFELDKPKILIKK